MCKIGCTLQSISLAVLAGLMLLGCSSSGDTVVPTPWPTLSSLIAVEDSSGLNSAGPQLIEKYRVDVESGMSSEFPLPGLVNQPVRIEVIVLSGDADPFVQIIGVQDEPLVRVDRGTTGQPEIIGQFQFPIDGYYSLSVGTVSGLGQVGISVYALDIAGLDGGGNLSSMPQILSGSMRHPASYHSFHIPVERGQRFNLSASALTQGLSLLIELYGPDGALNATSEADIDGNPHLWNVMPSRTGTYTMVLSNTDDHSGDYQVQISPSDAASEAALRVRTPFEVSDYKGAGSWLMLNGSAGDGIYLEATPHDVAVDLVASVYDQYGNRLAQVNQNGAGLGETIALVQFPHDGIYQIEFKSRAGAGSGDYYIRPLALAEIGMGGRIYPGGRKESGEFFGTAMSIVYLFEGSQGELVGVDAHATSGSGLDLGFDLYTPTGDLLVSRDDDVGKNPVIDRVELPVAGPYALIIWNYGGTMGTYDVFVTHPQSPSTSLPE